VHLRWKAARTVLLTQAATPVAQAELLAGLQGVGVHQLGVREVRQLRVGVPSQARDTHVHAGPHKRVPPHPQLEGARQVGAPAGLQHLPLKNAEQVELQGLPVRVGCSELHTEQP